MVSRLEITLKPDLMDAEGEKLRQRAKKYFDLEISRIRTIKVVTIDADLSRDQLATIQREIFTNPVVEISSFAPLDMDFDWSIWVGYRPGVRDNAGSTAVEAIEDVLGVELKKHEAVYTSRRYCIEAGNLSSEDVNKIAGELIANDIIQQWKIYRACDWSSTEGTGFILPKVRLDHVPEISNISIKSDEVLKDISDKRNLALNPNDIPVIRSYFNRPDVIESRARLGLKEPTDIEIEYISQGRSDHCNHNTFQGLFRYRDLSTGETAVEDNLFKTYIQTPTRALKEEKDWVVSVLWDNAGVGRLDDEYNYVITGETHNSPSNMEAYGGAITGIVGVYRDPLGTGLGSKLIMGGYGFCVGDLDYEGDLSPRLHPRRLLDGVIEGVKDGGNKSGIPTTYGQTMFHPGYMGKSLVFVTALGIMPAEVASKPSHKKKTSPGELIVMCGGRVGKDGIHGVTASSEVFSENTPAGHVQIGDPYTQKKMHDFILQARDEGLIEFITDNGGGGLSSSVGESARFSGGCEVDLDRVPLKYEGLDQWEIWVSESQERMTVSVTPENLERFMFLSGLHAVESTVIGNYTDSGYLHIRYAGNTCAWIDIDLLESGFPQWEFDAHWLPPEMRGFTEPVISAPADHKTLLLDMLSRPNICSKEWICRQYDHEVQGTSVVKPLVGAGRDVNSDASVIRPVLHSEKGIAYSQALLPTYSIIDAYHMMACTIDEAVRRLISVGATLDHIGGVDNFCWPDIQFDEEKNPDGRFKAAQLVRACRALRDVGSAYGIPLLSGKDSMYVDGHLEGKYGERRKVSALETVQFSATGVVGDVEKCITMDSKRGGDLIYLIGITGDELGASEYYEHFGETGLNVPRVSPESFAVTYRAVSLAIDKELAASVHGVYRGGLGVHLSMVAMGGGLGMDIDLSKVPLDSEKPLERDDKILYSESPGRFIITVAPEKKEIFEKVFNKIACEMVGTVTENGDFTVKGIDGTTILSAGVDELKTAWQKPFGDLI